MSLPSHFELTVNELRAAVDDAAMERGAEALYLPSVWHAMSEVERLAAQGAVWAVLKAVHCEGKQAAARDRIREACRGGVLGPVM